ncbi:MAG: D-tyrosyl-tRNA(Tyr) deacylase [Flavobacteriales bacterium]|nr:D-tyrosyl-tRNA(Tyr) deacylase [Flavobacteriales bacterium]
MKVVIQRVRHAHVKVDDVVIGQIQKGLMVLVGVDVEDNPSDADWLVGKIINMRIFEDVNGVMNVSVKDIDGSILAISQFTLRASTKKGNRPSYIKAAKPDQSIPLYEYFVQSLEKELGKKVETGKFGADMKVTLENDGPVTIVVDSKSRE